MMECVALSTDNTLYVGHAPRSLSVCHECYETRCCTWHAATSVSMDTTTWLDMKSCNCPLDCDSETSRMTSLQEPVPLGKNYNNNNNSSSAKKKSNSSPLFISPLTCNRLLSFFLILSATQWSAEMLTFFFSFLGSSFGSPSNVWQSRDVIDFPPPLSSFPI